MRNVGDRWDAMFKCCRSQKMGPRTSTRLEEQALSRSCGWPRWSKLGTLAVSNPNPECISSTPRPEFEGGFDAEASR